MISNVRGRSIIQGTKEVVLNLNNSNKDKELAAAVQTDGTEQSTHRISNEKFMEYASSQDPVH